MKVRILDHTQKINDADMVRRVTIESDGQEFIIEADAGGLVIRGKDTRSLTITPNSPSMIHVAERK